MTFALHSKLAMIAITGAHRSKQMQLSRRLENNRLSEASRNQPTLMHCARTLWQLSVQESP
jgi:hypothetical protein